MTGQQVKENMSFMPEAIHDNRGISIDTSDHSVESEPPTMENSSPKKEKKSVRFGSINIRKYNRILGDNPACSNGCPVQLGWDSFPQPIVPIDEYETNRLPRRTRRHLQLTAITRRNSLHYHFGYTHTEIEQGAEEIKKIKKQRLMTKSLTTNMEKREEFVQNVTRKIKRTFSREKIYYRPEWDQFKLRRIGSDLSMNQLGMNHGIVVVR